jgi:hypothetical protein
VDGTAAPRTAPATAGVWVAQSTGPGSRVLTWTATAGGWTIVIMNADASRGLTIRGDVGATVPALTGIATGLLIGGAVLLAGGVARGARDPPGHPRAKLNRARRPWWSVGGGTVLAYCAELT